MCDHFSAHRQYVIGFAYIVPIITEPELRRILTRKRLYRSAIATIALFKSSIPPSITHITLSLVLTLRKHICRLTNHTLGISGYNKYKAYL